MFFWNSLAFLMIQQMLNLISGSSAFSKSSLNIWKFMVHVLLKPGLENFEHYFERSLALAFFGIGMKTDLFPSRGHCWVFQICWQFEWSTLTAASYRVWNMEILSIPNYISLPSSLRLITNIFLEPASLYLAISQVVLILMPWTHPSCYPVFFH